MSADSTAAEAPVAPTPGKGRRFDWLHVTLIVLLSIIAAVGLTYWLVVTYVFPTHFKPVTLSASEEKVLDAKLNRLESPQAGAASQSSHLEPERYSEEGARREVAFSERELNALLAKNTDLAQKLAIDLSDNLVSAKLLVPMDPDFPILGGKTLKVRAGVELAYRGSRPVVVLRGISIMGVPLPNAWMGGIKNIDLVREYGGKEGFWKSFADGVDDIHVEEGKLVIKLKE